MSGASIIQQDWPSAELERVQHCPLCGDTTRELLHEGLRDWSFGAAPGEWSLYKCTSCGTAYLDPRPTADSIHRAYSVYYTHSAGPPPVPVGILAKFKYALANDYRRWRYGVHRQPNVFGGRFIGRLFPSAVRGSDLEYRYLPKEQGFRRLLDFGSGNGAFLLRAKAAGWAGVGIEPDPLARMAGRGAGLDLRASLADCVPDEGLFDAATLNHTIEHVHDPFAIMSAISSILRPGAHLFIETPNISAVGHRIYGPYWRGLEAPRHLVIFNPFSIMTLLERAGFRDIRFRSRPSPLPFLAQMSRLMATGRNPHVDEDPGPTAPPAPTSEDLLREESGPLAAEFITLTARKA